jgi:ADP-ribose pyrophosphatase YjhB (NUDIX family)
MNQVKYCPLCSTELTRIAIEGIDRIACPSRECDFVHWENPTPVVAAIVQHEGNVILARGVGWPEKMFGLITGFLERGETPEESILREVKEELGLRGEVQKFIGNYSYFELNQVLLVYHVIATGEIRLGSELEAHKRIPPEKLRPWPYGTGLAVKDWLEARQKEAND